MSAKINVRQRELEEQQRNMLERAILYVVEAQGDYSKPIFTEFFLAEFRVDYHASEYASKRYFKDFVTLEIFEPKFDGKMFTVTMNKKRQERMQRIYGVNFPEPKPQEVADKSGKC